MNLKKTRKRLLIVDDEPNIRLLVRRTCEKEFLVVEAKDGEEALRLAYQHIPDIIILDVMMPLSDGLTTLNKLKNDKRTSEIPVLMFTGAAHELNEKLAMSLGARAYLRKPVNSSELMSAIKKIIP